VASQRFSMVTASPNGSRPAPAGPRDRSGCPTSDRSGSPTSRATASSRSTRPAALSTWLSWPRSTRTGGPSTEPAASSSARTARRQVELLDLDGTATALVTRTDGADGPRFNSPNDVVVDSHGIIWFTDPAYGLQSPGEGHGGEMEYGGCHVFRLDPATGAISTVITDMVRPNGLAFSNDESILYVADSARAQGHGEDHGIRAYDVTTDGRCENGRSFAQIEQGVPDGFRVDHHGNIWTSRAFRHLRLHALGRAARRRRPPRDRRQPVCGRRGPAQPLHHRDDEPVPAPAARAVLTLPAYPSRAVGVV